MKTKLIYVLLPLMLLGCSKSQAANSQSSSAVLSNKAVISRPEITFVESPQTKEQKQIKKQALTLLTNGNYVGLEALAAKHRSSKEHYSSGLWKLAVVYNGLELSKNDSDVVWETRVKQVQDWSKARPEAATPRIALGRIMRSYAWKARGVDWADK